MGQNQNNPQASELPSGLAKPAARALTHSGLLTLEHIAKISEDELKQLHGIGPKAVELIRQALERNGLSFSENKK